MTVPQEPHHIANARLIGNVLLHHGPIFVDELIGTMTVLLLSYGNEGITVHGKDGAEELPVSGMGGHDDGSVTAFLERF